MQFPWLMYRKGPGLELPRGQRVSYQVAHDETEYAAALKAGWFPSVPEALAEKLDAPEVEKPAEPPDPIETAPEAPEAEPAPAKRGRPRKSA
jgi:hypothetical protein